MRWGNRVRETDVHNIRTPKKIVQIGRYLGSSGMKEGERLRKG